MHTNHQKFICIFNKTLAGVFVVALLLSALPTRFAYAEDIPPAPTTATEGEAGGKAEKGDAAEESVFPIITSNNFEGEPGTGGTEGPQGANGNTTEETTGTLTESGSATTTINTGDAHAEGDIVTTINNNLVVSTSTTIDLDEYVFHSTSTNDALIDTIASTTAVTGENIASSTDAAAEIRTGDATAVLNIANVVNTNIINSFGFMVLLNELMDGKTSFDMRDLFFPDLSTAQSTPSCTLSSCDVDDTTYTIENTNTASLTNNATLRAIAGANTASGESASIETGDAYGAANVVNIANSNIIDSNYLLVAINGIGNLDGDLVFPNEEMFRKFFAQPNALAYLDDADDATTTDSTVNNAAVNNNLDTVADTGNNNASTTAEADIATGNSSASSNVVNEINKTLFGGDSLYILIKVHGAWSGNVFGLPEGLVWKETSDGIAIYSSGGEISPSEVIDTDLDTYTANFNNKNDVTIDNNIEIYALTGENEIEGMDGKIDTGDAYAGANVVNMANTNVVGRNWVTAIFNILGDLNGDISFGRSDLWVGGQVTSSETPIRPGSLLTYTYTVKNNGDLKATNARLDYSFDWAEGGNLPSDELGTIRPGETREVVRQVRVRSNLPYGSIPLVASTTVNSSGSDNNKTDNTEMLELVVENPAPVVSGGGGGGGNGGGSVGGGGGGGGGGSSKKNTPASKLKGSVLGAKTTAKAPPKPVSEAKRKSPPVLTVTKWSDNKDGIVRAGSEVNYTILVKNAGGTAYDTKLSDTLRTPNGSVMNQQSWDLGDIQPNETIKVTYTVKFKKDTPNGVYKNAAHLVAYRKDNDPTSLLKVKDASRSVSIKGVVGLAVGNVEVLRFYPNPDGTFGAMVAWESSSAADGQVFWSAKGLTSPYNSLLPNFGYAKSSSYLPFALTKHHVYIDGLVPGKEYAYRVRSKTILGDAFSSETTFVVPGTHVPPAVSTAPMSSKPMTQKPKPATVKAAVTTSNASLSASASVEPTPSAPKNLLGAYVSNFSTPFKFKGLFQK